MLLKDYPECFGSYKVYEVVKKVMINYARETDINQMLTAVMADGGAPDNFIKKIAIHSKRHMNVNKSSEMVMAIKDKMSSLIGIQIEPKMIKITKEGSDNLRVFVENKTDGMLKFKAGVQQIDRDHTSILYDPVRNFTHTKLVKAAVIPAEKTHVFKFIIKPDVFGIHDLCDLKKNNSVKITLGLQVAADGIDGMKTLMERIPVNIVRVKI